jgi:hypothetical protein
MYEPNAIVAHFPISAFFALQIFFFFFFYAGGGLAVVVALPQSLSLLVSAASNCGTARCGVELTLKTLGTVTVSLVASPLAETTVTVGLDMVAVVNGPGG